MVESGSASFLGATIDNSFETESTESGSERDSSRNGSVLDDHVRCNE